jgi:predicted nucleic acid-binding protein
MVNIFIDTNILLNIYHFSGDDLEELDKLALLIRNGKATFFLPDQVRDEFYRNRDNKIADALKEFRKEKIDRQFPQMAKQYDEYKKMRDAIKLFEENKQGILEKLTTDIITNNLKADKIVEELFANSKSIPTSDEIFNVAKMRFDLGRPPGKNKSYGDAINWECLKTTVPDGEELFFITDDSDFLSDVNNNNFNPYLLNEWRSNKGSTLSLFKNLTGFFREKFPEIQLVDEYEKNLLIERLAKSSNFARTHSVLAQLSIFDDYTQEQANEIILASVSNSQIYWIATDQDVNEILNKIARTHSKLIDPDLLERFYEVYNETPDTEE